MRDAKPMNNAQGFTLIELLVVMVIGGIMVAAVSSSVGSGNQSTVLKGAARDVSSALRYARGHAMTRRKESTVRIDLENNSYRVSDKDKTYKLSDDIEITLDVAQSQIQDSQGAVRFFPDGSSTGGRITLEIEEMKRQLDINWLTGQVEISEP
ncbi:MAG: GspH/FimT family pseudopilin [Methylococcales bacterium]|nr:GspH/FimT family pseudopilin [Methylococcales bacterium]